MVVVVICNLQLVMLIDDDGCMLWVELIVSRREREVFSVIKW